jgi:hypothetical protein
MKRWNGWDGDKIIYEVSDATHAYLAGILGKLESFLGRHLFNLQDI